MLPKWTAIYFRNDNKKELKSIDVFAETVFKAWWNAMNVIQILEKTEQYQIKSVNPKKAE